MQTNTMKKHWFNTTKPVALAAMILGLAVTNGRSQAAKVDPTLPDYKPVSGVSGNLNAVGSDTLNNLMALWSEGFKAIYPNVKIQVEGKGSSTAPPALIQGAAQLGPMSREMKSSEVDAFEKAFGYKPQPIRVAIDALAVYVHKDNPVKSLSLKDVDGMFSSTRKRGGKEIKRWGDLGVTAPLAGRPVSLYGRNSASGTYGYFKKVALDGGDYKSTVKEQPGSSSVVQGIASDLGGIGYSGIGYKTSGVRAVPLAANRKAYEATAQNSLSGKYPLARFLLIYVNKKPGQELDKLTAEFIKFALSKQGQEIVIKDGYFAMPGKAAKAEAELVSKK